MIIGASLSEPHTSESNGGFFIYIYIYIYIYTVVSRKYAPPFATLASVQNAGGACTRDATISLAITPPPPPPPPSGTDKAWPHCRWGWGPSTRQKDAPDATGRLKSFNVEGRGSRALPRSSWRVHRWCGRFAFAIDTSTVDSRVAWVNTLNISTAGWVFFGGAYARDKNTSVRVCAKNAGGAYARGGAYLRDTTVYIYLFICRTYVVP